MNNLIVRVSIFLIILVSAPLSLADTLGIHMGIGSWQNDSDGDIYSLLTAQDTSDLGMDDENTNFLFIKFEHPVPLMPNIRLAQSGANNPGSIVYTNPAMQEVRVDTDIDLAHIDYTFYWEIIDIAGIDFDLGLTGRDFDGGLDQDVYINGVLVQSERRPIKGTIPMLYVNFKTELPLTGLYFGAEANALSYSGDGFTDIVVKVGWATDNWIMPEFGLEAGYRRFSLDIDQSNKLNTTLNLTMDGYYVGLVAHF